MRNFNSKGINVKYLGKSVKTMRKCYGNYFFKKFKSGLIHVRKLRRIVANLKSNLNIRKLKYKSQWLTCESRFPKKSALIAKVIYKRKRINKMSIKQFEYSTSSHTIGLFFHLYSRC